MNKIKENIKKLPIIKIYLENKQLKKEVRELEDKINDMQWGFKNIVTIINGYKKINPALWLAGFNQIKDETQKFI